MNFSTDATLELKIDEVNAATIQAFRETAFITGREFTRVITQPRGWDGWGVRDIVDTGQLRSSQQLRFPSPLAAEFSWPVEYATEIHEGVTYRSGGGKKGRPWTTVALKEMDVEEVFNERYQAALNNIK